jgi:hypothetical protein
VRRRVHHRRNAAQLFREAGPRGGSSTPSAYAFAVPLRTGVEFRSASHQPRSISAGFDEGPAPAAATIWDRPCYR